MVDLPTLHCSGSSKSRQTARPCRKMERKKEKKCGTCAATGGEREGPCAGYRSVTCRDTIEETLGKIRDRKIIPYRRPSFSTPPMARRCCRCYALGARLATSIRPFCLHPVRPCGAIGRARPTRERETRSRDERRRRRDREPPLRSRTLWPSAMRHLAWGGCNTQNLALLKIDEFDFIK